MYFKICGIDIWIPNLKFSLYDIWCLFIEHRSEHLHNHGSECVSHYVLSVKCLYGNCNRGSAFRNLRKRAVPAGAGARLLKEIDWNYGIEN